MRNYDYANWIIAVATVVTMVFIIMQWWVFNKQRKDNLFKMRDEHYCELLSFFYNQLKFYEIYENNMIRYLEDMNAFLKDINATRLLAKTEYLFDASLANHLRDNIFNLGKINHESKKIEFNDIIEKRFESFFKS
jgi:hypothetical protein